MAQDEGGIVAQLLNLGEDRMGEVVNQLLANEAFVGVLQNTISRSLAAKRSVDSTLGTVLGAANVPTLEDVEEVRDKLVELEDVMVEVEDRLKRVVKRVASLADEDDDDDDDDDEPAPKKARKASSKATKKTKPGTKKAAKKAAKKS